LNPQKSILVSDEHFEGPILAQDDFFATAVPESNYMASAPRVIDVLALFTVRLGSSMSWHLTAIGKLKQSDLSGHPF
jgi:hypothetical protein